ncbi:MAG: hypothetical protein IJT65_06610 [Eubacterium sp.]|nr:hypothetical protein [Eubacterium sp.]
MDYNEVLKVFLKYLPYMLFSGFMSLGWRIFLTVAVYNDSKARALVSKTAYTVFTFLFPLITGIIYLCSRNNAKTSAPKLCTSCGTTVQPDFNFCPNCNSPYLVSYEVHNANKLKSNAKTFMIVAICCFIASHMVNASYQTKFAEDLRKATSGNSSSSPYGDFKDFEDFFEQYEDQNGGNNGNDNNNDNDSAADDFNNFGNNN